MNVALINPPLMVLGSDPLTTGIPYMPVSLAYAAGALRAKGHAVQVVDAFGEDPCQYRRQNGFMIRGLTPSQVGERISPEAQVLVLYAGNLTSHRSLEEIVGYLHHRRPGIPQVVMENTQAVTAYSLRRVLTPLFHAGADYILCGEAEERLPALMDCIKLGTSPLHVDGIGWRDGQGEHFSPPSLHQNPDLDSLPLPAWELFHLQEYWSLRYAHGPLERRRYLPLLTSRGCPYACRFCVIPETTHTRWRGRSPESVAGEMAHWRRVLGVTEFHIEDVNPTVDDGRMKRISKEIVDRELDVIWKISAGTKVETIKSEETVDWMARAGCRYISISPESGSPEVLKRIGKPFDMEHALRVVRWMGRRGIRSQCCFVLGFPGEKEQDRRMTWGAVRRFVREGVDEIALFIVTPVPGSKIFDDFVGFSDYSQLNFSPVWREDFASLNRFRWKLYGAFFFWKLLFHPWKLLGQPVRFFLRRFGTKMEMTPYRALHTFLMERGFLGRRVSWEPI